LASSDTPCQLHSHGVFLFSSRRRHTRSKRDWSSDVCSSDLNAYQPCDAAVSSTYRGQGIFKSLRLRGLDQAEKSNGQLLFNFPNSNSLHLNTRLGAKHLGKIVWR